jgi:hypothetical protein
MSNVDRWRKETTKLNGVLKCFGIYSFWEE